jgi:hypothetical protein
MDVDIPFGDPNQEITALETSTSIADRAREWAKASLHKSKVRHPTNQLRKLRTLPKSGCQIQAPYELRPATNEPLPVPVEGGFDPMDRRLLVPLAAFNPMLRYV